MRIEISHLLGVREARFALTPGRITLVTGSNAVGKSSTALGAGAVLALAANPYGAAASDKTAYRRDGTDTGHVLLFDDDDRESARWVLNTGEMMAIDLNRKPVSPSVVGLVDFIGSMSPAARVQLWEEHFLPSHDKLIGQIEADLGKLLEARIIKAVVETIKKSDWKSAAGIFADRMAKAKRDWAEITGERYGSKKAPDWRPKEWFGSYDGVTLEDAEKGLQAARDRLTGTHVAVAVDQAAEVRAAEARARIPDLRAAEEAARGELEEAERHFVEQQTALSEVMAKARKVQDDLAEHMADKPDQVETLACPECGTAVILDEGRLVHFDAALHQRLLDQWERDKGDIEARKPECEREYTDAKRRFDAAKDERDRRQTAQTEAQAALRVAQSEAAPPHQGGGGTATAAEVEAADREVELARLMRDAIKQRDMARRHHETVVQNTIIAERLGPSGIRARAMNRELSILDATLAKIAEISGWPRVALDKSYAVSIGGRSLLRACAETDQLTAQLSLQIAISRCKREPVVVLDRVSNLVHERRAKLIAMLQALATREAAPAFLVCGSALDVGEWPAELTDAYRIGADNVLVAA